MTIKEKIMSLVNDTDWSTIEFSDHEHCSPEKLAIMAYYIGLEEATRDVSNAYNQLIAEQNERAEKCRYHKMAHDIVGEKQYIYSSNYSGEMTATFGGDLV